MEEQQKKSEGEGEEGEEEKEAAAAEAAAAEEEQAPPLPEGEEPKKKRSISSTNTVTIQKGTLVWAPLGAAFWPAEVAEDATAEMSLKFPNPNSSVLVKVVILGLELPTRAPLVSLRPIADAFELRAAETSRATAAGRVAVELARERMRKEKNEKREEEEQKEEKEEQQEEEEMETGE